MASFVLIGKGKQVLLDTPPARPPLNILRYASGESDMPLRHDIVSCLCLYCIMVRLFPFSNKRTKTLFLCFKTS